MTTNLPSCSYNLMEVKDLHPKDRDVINSKLKDLLVQAKDIDKKKEEIFSCIIALGTFKRLQEEFPEAYNKIPKESLNGRGSSYLPARNLQDIRNYVKGK